MPPVSRPSEDEYDFIVIGGGSGGIGAAVRAVSPQTSGKNIDGQFLCSGEREAMERRSR